MEPATRLPHGRAQIRRTPLRIGQENRPRPQARPSHRRARPTPRQAWAQSSLNRPFYPARPHRPRDAHHPPTPDPHTVLVPAEIPQIRRTHSPVQTLTLAGQRRVLLKGSGHVGSRSRAHYGAGQGYACGGPEYVGPFDIGRLRRRRSGAILGREVLVPITLAVLLSFVLAPLVFLVAPGVHSTHTRRPALGRHHSRHHPRAGRHHRPAGGGPRRRAAALSAYDRG